MKDFDFARELISWYDENKRDLPWRNTRDPYAIWVSEIMLQQTRVEAVKPYYARFLSALPTVRDLASADEEQLYKLWQGLGYYSRVRNMKKAAAACVESHGGKLPGSYEELRRLCGIGDYTAGAVAAFAYGEAVPAIDGNVLRVCARFLGIDSPIDGGAAKDEIRSFVEKEMPKDRPDSFDQALIELGATLCGPDKAARCGGCPLLTGCRAFAENKTEVLPVRKPKAERRVLERTPLILLSNGAVCLCKRPPKGLLAGLWEPPTLEGVKTEDEVRAFLSAHGCTPESIAPLPRARHIFTHVVWEMDAFLVKVSDRGDLPFYSVQERRGLAVPSAFKSYADYIFPND